MKVIVRIIIQFVAMIKLYIKKPFVEMTLKKVLHKLPARLIKAVEGENSHAHKLCGGNGADFILPVPTGISVISQTGVKLG